MIHRYAEWTRKQGRTAQCSPALGIVAILVVAAVTVYIYRQVIITTVITAVLAAVGVAVFTGVMMLVVSTLRWYRKQNKSVPAHVVKPVTDAAAIRAEADWLAGGVELAFSPDGKLVKKEK